MWWRKAKPGDKIVCITREKWLDAPGNEYCAEGPSHFPTYDEVYTVEDIGAGPCGEIYVKPAELYAAFNVKKFRPVDPASKKADRVLASLKPSLLNQIPVRKHETAGGE